MGHRPFPARGFFCNGADEREESKVEVKRLCGKGEACSVPRHVIGCDEHCLTLGREILKPGDLRGVVEAKVRWLVARWWQSTAETATANRQQQRGQLHSLKDPRSSTKFHFTIHVCRVQKQTAEMIRGDRVLLGGRTRRGGVRDVFCAGGKPRCVCGLGGG